MLLSQITLISEELVQLITELQTLHTTNMQRILYSILRSEWLVIQIKHTWYMEVPQCVHIYMSSGYPIPRMICYTSQVKSHSPVCTRWCFFRVPWSVNDLLHTSHAYGHSPVCRRRCTFRLPCSVNDLLHTAQIYRNSPIIFMHIIHPQQHHGHYLLQWISPRSEQ